MHSRHIGERRLRGTSFTNCPVLERTGDGRMAGRCTFYLPDGRTCPRHGDIFEFPDQDDKVYPGRRLRVIVAGTRTITDYDLVKNAITNSGFDIGEIVSGESLGVDACAKDYAEANRIKYTPFPANWLDGRKGGPIRNSKMAEYGEAVILVWDGTSRGSADMRAKAIAKSLPIYEVIQGQPNAARDPCIDGPWHDMWSTNGSPLTCRKCPYTLPFYEPAGAQP